MPSYYFDTNALLKYYRSSAKGSLTVRRLVSSHNVILSSLTQLEFTNVLMKEYRRGNLRRSEAERLVERLRRDISITGVNTNRPFRTVEMPDGIFKRAENLLLLNFRTDIVANDALHIAIVEKLSSAMSDLVMVSSDNGIKYVCNKIALATFDPEIEP